MPYFGSTLFFVALALLFVSSLTALCLLVYALSPGLIQRAAGEVGARPFRSALIGVPALGLTMLVVAAAGSAGPPLKIVAFVLLGLGALLAATGLSAVAARVGAGLGAEGVQAVLRGDLVLLFASLLPFVGWFLIAPLTLFVGAGAVLSASLRRSAARPVASEAGHVASL